MQPQVVLEGRLGQDPTLTFTQSGLAACSFSMGHTARVKQGEEWVDGDTSWFRITAWRKLAENCASSLHKGDLVIVVARPRENKWTDKEGVERRTIEFTADAVGASLTFAEVAITRTTGGGRSQEAARPAPQATGTGGSSDAPWF